MQRGIAWALAFLMLAAAAWIARDAWRGDGPAPDVAAAPEAVEALPVAEPQATRRTVLRRESLADALPDVDDAAPVALAARAPDPPADDPDAGGARDSGDRRRPPLVGSGGSSGSAAAGRGPAGPGDAGDALLPGRVGRSDDAGDAGDPAVESQPQYQELERQAADAAEDLGIYTPPELEARIGREMARSGSDYDTAKQKVLADGLAWDELAKAELGPDASTAEKQRYVDAAKTYGPGLLDPAQKQDLWARSLGR